MQQKTVFFFSRSPRSYVQTTASKDHFWGETLCHGFPAPRSQLSTKTLPPGDQVLWNLKSLNLADFSGRKPLISFVGAFQTRTLVVFAFFPGPEKKKDDGKKEADLQRFLEYQLDLEQPLDSLGLDVLSQENYGKVLQFAAGFVFQGLLSGPDSCS